MLDYCWASVEDGGPTLFQLLVIFRVLHPQNCSAQPSEY